MTDGIKLELKTVLVAVSIATALISVGWFGASLTFHQMSNNRRIEILERENGTIKDKLASLDRIGDAVVRIESDVKELKKK